jgi:uncharacterized protein YjbI with pentapeptide repeats
VFLRQEHLTAADFSDYRGDFGALGCVFEACDFRRMRPRQISFASGMEPTRYVDCTFDGSKFQRIIEGLARFERCSFKDITIDKFFGHATEFIDCEFSGVLRHSVFFGLVAGFHRGKIARTTNEFRGNNFAAATLIDVGFREGVDLSQQRLPVGPDYIYLRDAGLRLAALRQKHVHRPPSATREEIFRFLRQAEEEVQQGQHDLFWTRESLAVRDRRSLDAVWKELQDVAASSETNAQ